MRILIALILSAAMAAANPLFILAGRPPAGAGFTYLLNEDFEGTGWPSGWWSGSTANPDNTTTPIAGAQDLQCNSNASEFVFSSVQGEIYGKFRFTHATHPASFMRIMVGRDASFNASFIIIINSDGTLTVSSGSIYETTTAAVATATSYYIWFHYSKGTGANAVARVWLSTSDTKPGDGSSSSAGASNGDSTADIEALDFQSLEGTPTPCRFDNTQAAITDF